MLISQCSHIQGIALAGTKVQACHQINAWVGRGCPSILQGHQSSSETISA
jgi:hypothetical protein